MNKLHPGTRWLFRFQAYYPLMLFGLFITIWGLQLIALIFKDLSTFGFVISIVFYITFLLIIGEVYARMAYNRYLYEITNEGVKLEKGIVWKKYTSIPYERVQNVDIKRGLVARMFGFSTVEIETAGQSGMNASYGFRFGGRRSRQYKSEGHLPGVDLEEAEKIRGFVMKKIKQTHKDKSGL